MIRITARTEGFRRCGVAHTTTGRDWPDDAWSEVQLARLEADPMLVVQRLEDVEKSAETEKGKPRATARKTTIGKATTDKATDSVDAP